MFNSIVNRTDADPLIPQEVSDEILKSLSENFWLLNVSRRLPDMSAAQRRLPVLNAFATAYFVDGDTGLKKTTEVDWANKYIDAEELAVIVPVPINVIEDSQYDLWGEIRPELEAAFSAAITAAVLYGTNIPATWTTNLGAAGLVALANARSHVLSLANGNFDDFYHAMEGENGVISLLEDDGFDPTAHVAHNSVKSIMRGTRAEGGELIYKAMPQDGAVYRIDGAPVIFPTDGSIDSAQALVISGDWSKLVYAVRKDITYSVATEGVITDAANNIVYNLFQQDMVALRAVMRLGFALPNPINRMEPTEASRLPFAILTA